MCPSQLSSRMMVGRIGIADDCESRTRGRKQLAQDLARRSRRGRPGGARRRCCGGRHGGDDVLHGGRWRRHGGVTYQTMRWPGDRPTIDRESWDANGGNGSIVQYHELLVVKNSQTVHGKIKSAVWEMMRASAGRFPRMTAEPRCRRGPAGGNSRAAPELGAPEIPVDMRDGRSAR